MVSKKRISGWPYFQTVNEDGSPKCDKEGNPLPYVLTPDVQRQLATGLANLLMAISVDGRVKPRRSELAAIAQSVIAGDGEPVGRTDTSAEHVRTIGRECGLLPQPGTPWAEFKADPQALSRFLRKCVGPDAYQTYKGNLQAAEEAAVAAAVAAANAAKAAKTAKTENTTDEEAAA